MPPRRAAGQAPRQAAPSAKRQKQTPAPSPPPAAAGAAADPEAALWAEAEAAAALSVPPGDASVAPAAVGRSSPPEPPLRAPCPGSCPAVGTAQAPRNAVAAPPVGAEGASGAGSAGAAAALGSGSGGAEWEVRNLTHEAELRTSDPQLQRAERAHAQAEAALHRCERSVSGLPVHGGAAASAGAVDGPCEEWCAQVEREAEAAAQEREAAAARLASVRARVGALPPGPALLDANAELGRAHAEAQAAARESERLRRMAAGAQRSAQSLRALQRGSAQRGALRDGLADARRCLQQLQSAAPSGARELREASERKEAVPSSVLHVRGSPALASASSAEAPALHELPALLRARWALRLGPCGCCRRGSPGSPGADGGRECLLPLQAVLAALGPGAGAVGGRDPGEVLLAARPPARGAGGSCCSARARYLTVPPGVAAALRERGTRPPEVPGCIELLRSALGLGADGVALADAARQAVLRAVQPRPHAVPAGLGGRLRPYQLQGFRWLASHAANGLGCLLADDMGLGKTLQAVALLLHLRAEGRLGGARPALVVAPLSALGVWQQELRRWAPGLRCRLHHGAQRALGAAPGTDPGAARGADVLVTTYSTLQRDVERLQAEALPQFACICLDESQLIKNAASRTAQAVKRLAAASSCCARVALSGTPVENRLGELHSVFDFLNPGLLGARRHFAAAFEQPLKRAQEAQGRWPAEVLERLGRMVAPFMLRRVKTDASVAPELPEKLELTHVVSLTPAQSSLYAAVAEEGLRRVRSPHLGSGDGDGELTAHEEEVALGEPSSAVTGAEVRAAPGAGQGTGLQRRRRILAVMHGLQQVCNHPAALPVRSWPSAGAPPREAPECAAVPAASGKTTRLLELLEEVLEPLLGEKVLVFTQYLATLELLAGLVGAAFPAVRVLRFHGAMGAHERDAAVRAFQEDPACAVMLLSLRAGGLGLTLTAATHVVHFDRCWNPAREAQATDRAHRLGQRRTVVVHRLLAAGTLEERLAAVLAQKRRLAAAATPGLAAADAAQVLLGCSDAELLEALRLGAALGQG